MRKILKVILAIFAMLTVYVIGGIIVDQYIFPASKPDLTNYFRSGDKLLSKYEGFDQTVLEVKDGWLHTRLEVAPNAAGPPEHFHETFEEIFTVKSGTLSILYNGEKRTLKAGETISIPPMTRHKPFNETNEVVVVEREDPKTLPVQFGYILSQLYGFMDEYPAGPSVPTMMMQLSVFGNDADAWMAEGPPIGVQKAMRVVMAPTARLLGYRNYYADYKPTS